MPAQRDASVDDSHQAAFERAVAGFGGRRGLGSPRYRARLGDPGGPAPAAALRRLGGEARLEEVLDAGCRRRARAGTPT